MKKLLAVLVPMIVIILLLMFFYKTFFGERTLPMTNLLLSGNTTSGNVETGTLGQVIDAISGEVVNSNLSGDELILDEESDNLTTGSTTASGKDTVGSIVISGQIPNLSGGVNKTPSSAVDIQLQLADQITRNEQYSKNLILLDKPLVMGMGKWSAYVSIIASPRGDNDQLKVVRDVTKLTPMKYNADNAIAYKKKRPAQIYQPKGLTVIPSEDGYVYYAASNDNGQMFGYILSLARGTTLQIANLKPLLFYKDIYLFTTQSGSFHQGISTISGGRMTSIADVTIWQILIDDRTILIYDPNTKSIKIYDQATLAPLYSLTSTFESAKYVGYTSDTTSITIKVLDNMNNKYTLIEYNTATQTETKRTPLD